MKESELTKIKEVLNEQIKISNIYDYNFHQIHFGRLIGCTKVKLYTKRTTETFWTPFVIVSAEICTGSGAADGWEVEH